MISILLLGDSITEGIGSKKRNYESIIQRELDCTIYNYSLTGTTITAVKTIVNSFKECNPDYIVVMYGNVDVQIRPNMEKNRFHIISIIPKHYRTIKGILNPRPYFSKTYPRRLLHLMDNVVRAFLKKIVVLTQGYHQYFTSEEFAIQYDSTIKRLRNLYPDTKIICVSTVPVDERIYPGTNREYIQANKFIQRVVNNNRNTYYADIYNILLGRLKVTGWGGAYYNDHFHPNESGYELIGVEISNTIRKVENNELININIQM